MLWSRKLLHCCEPRGTTQHYLGRFPELLLTGYLVFIPCDSLVHTLAVINVHLSNLVHMFRPRRVKNFGIDEPICALSNEEIERTKSSALAPAISL